ncbi:MAG TPA: hypothetical protein VN989_05460 [Casimicrobiaceae bacterium]|nr:hypothetical protein [Casimicrobiaceae bacterium]
MQADKSMPTAARASERLAIWRENFAGEVPAIMQALMRKPQRS